VADAFSRIARAVAEDVDDDDALVPLREAARIAATSMRVLRKAIRSGELSVYGRTRDRAVRRRDLLAWIEDRRIPSVPGPDDDDVARRVQRLTRQRRLPPGSPRARALPEGKP
jgi:hypothetical protein